MVCVQSLGGGTQCGTGQNQPGGGLIMECTLHCACPLTLTAVSFAFFAFSLSNIALLWPAFTDLVLESKFCTLNLNDVGDSGIISQKCTLVIAVQRTNTERKAEGKKRLPFTFEQIVNLQDKFFSMCT